MKLAAQSAFTEAPSTGPSMDGAPASQLEVNADTRQRRHLHGEKLASFQDLAGAHRRSPACS